MRADDRSIRTSHRARKTHHPRFGLQSLSTRFLLAFAVVALLGVGTVALIANWAVTHQFALYLTRGGQVRAQQWAGLAAEYYTDNNSWQDFETVLESASPMRGPGRGSGRGWMMQGTMGASDDRLLIVDPEGWVVLDTEEELVGQSVEAEIQQLGVPITVRGQTVGTLLVTTRDLSGRSELERRFVDAVNRAVLWSMLLVAAASLVAAALLSRQLIAPLRQLTGAAEAMADGDLSQRVDVHSPDEVGELGRAFNKMASDLQMAEAQRRQLTADIAHELRNPLSVIRGNLEAIDDGVYPADGEHLAPIYEETMLLQRLVEDLRLLSLVDTGQLPLVRTDVDLSKLLGGVADSARAAAQERRISVKLDVPSETLVVEGDTDRLRQVVSNLVSNALRFTPVGGVITLSARRANGRMRIAVSDTGKGISAEDLPRIFDRFYRGDPARDRASGGSGLGLAIARALVQAHDGTIHVESVIGQGTTFTVEL